MRIRRSGLAFGIGTGLLGLGVLVLVLGVAPLFFAAWFAAAGLVGVFLGRRRKLVVHRSTWSDSAGWQDNVALVVVRAVQIRLRRGGAIRYHQVVLFEGARGDDCTGELRRMATHVDDGIARGSVFDSVAAQAEFEDRLSMLGMECRKGGRVVASRFTHAGSRRLGVMLAWCVACPLLDLVDTRPRIQGPESLRVPYLERIAAWRDRSLPGPIPPRLHVEEDAGALCVVFPGVTMVRVVLFLIAACAGGLACAGFDVIGPAVAALSAALFLIFLGVGVGARLQADLHSVRFRWRLPWCRTRVIALQDIDTIRVFENSLAILATTGSVEIGTGAAHWLRRRIEALALDA
jgi:hypothetical protein